MTIIKCLAEKIEEELQDAGDYIELAIKWKSEQPQAADLFYELSKEEMGHMDRLHGQAVALIEDYKVKHGEPPKDMMVLWNYLHEKHMAAATQVKVKQGMYQMQ